MSMLAGPRRKQKVINLRANNNAWSNDASKFGQRMLEKMGWTSGKGLGAKEDGIVQHVVARYKNDEKGLGFEDRNDQWTKHEDDFNALLSNLSNANSDDEKMHSGVSLEDKSKKSKARIHYHKYTRGKDLSRYSEKDIANIFGKKSLKEVGNEIDEILNEDCKTTEQKFTEKGSMTDYFKNKRAAMKGQKPAMKEIFDNTSSYQGFGYHSDAENNYQGFGFSKEPNNLSNNENTSRSFGFQPAPVDAVKDAQELYDIISEDLESSKKKKKKKKAERDTEENITETNDNINAIESNDTHNVHLTKRKKKKQIQNGNITENDHVEIQNVEPTHELEIKDRQIKKKKKKSKTKNIERNQENDEFENEPCDQTNASALIYNLNDDGTQSAKEKQIKKEINSEEVLHIFGKKSLKEVENEIDKILNEDCKTTEQKFTEKESMTDYFKNKLAAMKGQKPAMKEIFDNTSSYRGFGYHSDAENNYQGFGFSTEPNNLSSNENTYGSFGFQPAPVDAVKDAQELYDIISEDLESSKKKKKKKKAERDTEENITETNDNINAIESNDTHNVHLTKRKKKKQIQNGNITENDHVEIQNVEPTHELEIKDRQIKKKKKKSKTKNIERNQENEEFENEPCDQTNASALIYNLNDDGTQSAKKKKLNKKMNSELLKCCLMRQKTLPLKRRKRKIDNT